MGVLDRVASVVLGSPAAAGPAGPTAGRVMAAASVVEPTPRPIASDALVEAIARQRLAMLGRESALSIPAVRRVLHVLIGTITTFELQLWRGNSVIDGPPWLTQPEKGRPLPATLHRTVSDLVWHDRAHWRIVDSYVDTSRPINEWFPARFAYVSADRVLPVHDPADVDAPKRYLIDGQSTNEQLVNFDGSGLGGLRIHGAAMLGLYQRLMDAASRYAESPMPSVYLHNTGADLEDTEIDALLNSWETSRVRRATAYLNSVLKAETLGWSAKELQLTEAREQAAVETARLFGMPAYAANATEGDSMTYNNQTDRRRDIAEALRPWLSIIESTLSMPNVTPRGQRIRFSVDAYVRDDPETRMRTWQSALASGVLSREEIRSVEPLATLPDADAPPATPPAIEEAP